MEEFNWKSWIVVTIFLLFVGCAQIYEPVQGLCYTDKTGTYVCRSYEALEEAKNTA
jgi:hypothetical protein